jgi:hypothetical protein
MKTRNGFVSNSSSASFIVRWKLNRDDVSKEQYFDAAFCTLFGNGYDENYKPDFDIWGLEKEYEVIKRYTEIKENGELETVFTTSMLNTVLDFGETASHFNLALDFPESSAIIVLEKRIERDE